jgi:CheY-like chemotaxis protein
VRETTVIVVASSPFALALMGDLLEANGITTRQVVSAAEALECMAVQAPAMVILDLDLPSAETRILVEGMRRSVGLRDLPVLSVGSTRQRAAFEAVRQMGVEADDVGLSKPLDTGTFPRRVMREIQRQSTSSGRPALL